MYHSNSNNNNNKNNNNGRKPISIKSRQPNTKPISNANNHQQQHSKPNFSPQNLQEPGGQVAKKRKLDSDIIKDPESKGQDSRIQVVIRCRGSKDDDSNKSSPGVFLSKDNPAEIHCRTGEGEDSNKVYTFDRVYGPTASQQNVFDEVAAPIVDQVLDGYSCTIFAYGQTGTGKTHTIEGKLEEAALIPVGKAGIIPRVLDRLFEKLNATPSPHMYVVKLSMLEIYNEDVFDLLVAQDNLSPIDKLILNVDAANNLYVKGLTERIVLTPDEGIDFLRQGSNQRQKTATCLNSSSSRSHCILTLTVSSTIPSEGGDVHRLGKINLVDLAGSEDIGRSGAVDQHAKEAGKINRSLLALGKVISQLYRNSQKASSEAPTYRESKLTRILKDSLGGGTRTCIIATVSMASIDMKETLSTLKYANQAKCITNQIKTILPKPPLVLYQEYRTENERLKMELKLFYESNGVRIPVEDFMNLKKIESEFNDRVKEASDIIEKASNENSELKRLVLQRTNEVKEEKYKLSAVQDELDASKAEIEDLERQLLASQERLKQAEIRSEQCARNEKQLDFTAHSLLKAAETRDAYIAWQGNKLEQTQRSQNHSKQGVAEMVSMAGEEMSKQKEHLLQFTHSLNSHKDSLLLLVEETKEKIVFETRGVIAELQDHVHKSHDIVLTIQDRERNYFPKLKDLLQKLDETKERFASSISREVGAVFNKIERFQTSRDAESKRYQTEFRETLEKLDSWAKKQLDHLSQVVDSQAKELDSKANEISRLKAEMVAQSKRHHEEVAEWMDTTEEELDLKRKGFMDNFQTLFTELFSLSTQKRHELSAKYTHHLQLQTHQVDRLVAHSKDAVCDAMGRLATNSESYQGHVHEISSRYNQALDVAKNDVGNLHDKITKTLASEFPNHLNAITDCAQQLKGETIAEFTSLADEHHASTNDSLASLGAHHDTLLPKVKTCALQMEDAIDLCLDQQRNCVKSFRATTAQPLLNSIEESAQKSFEKLSYNPFDIILPETAPPPLAEYPTSWSLVGSPTKSPHTPGRANLTDSDKPARTPRPVRKATVSKSRSGR